MKQLSIVFISGLILGGLIVGAAWHRQWTSLDNQEIRSYIEYQGDLRPEDKVEAPALLPEDHSEIREGGRYRLAEK